MKWTTSLIAFAVTGVAFAAGPAPVVSLAQAQQETVEERVARLERAFEARQSGQARMLQQLNQLQREISELRGITEQHANQLDQILERQRDLYQEIDRRISEVRGSGSSLGTSVDMSTGSGEVSENETAYDRAIRLVLEERRYDLAIPEFESFIATNPDSPYRSNAHYWLGQLYLVEENYAEAESNFSTVVDMYPDSSKRADCIYKLGLIKLATGDTAAAQEYFNRVQSEYPDSTEAGLAQQQLDSL
ncbi:MULTISPECIES: tol-pal system protein YbgF [Gammaproteobacteria]|uniref:tol-pal system protein YbgF n=1 Tax=Gammaproteobacteria TaxID=1236 RepID=UPI000DCFDCEC|nr:MULTISPECIES: tol-pal system protein YbgF [Gammaproteobacteria]RTE87770.1 tol-pal system protein YbgF [Aliidiomarina sp. B3213]TCZ92447.1 tol-pal system protein YbgF [Lysobacter sp. N42]